MFGRSGQMFPRRTYHDAIYEEEYGSETEEECCRGRGLSAILCWFLSVVVLIGLAASVVLTVFFILKSRSTLAKNNQEDFNPDLNFVLDHGNGFKVTPTTTDYNLNYTSSKVPVGLGSEEMPMTTTYVETRTTSTTTTTTKVPTTTRLTTRKYWSDTTGDPYGDLTQKTTAMPLTPTTDSNSMFKILFNTIKTFNDSPQYGESVEQTPIDEVISNESVERSVPHPAPPTPTTSSPTPSSYLPTTTRTMTSTSPVLFTLPPNTSTMSQFNKKSPTTRFPVRTSFSSEDTAATTYQQYEQTKQYGPASVSSSEETETTSEISTTVKPSPHDEENYQEEESLKKMLIDQIPPHNDNHQTTSTTTTSSPTTTITEDLLAKIIKNLQPKWNKTKEASTSPPGTLGPTRTRNRYIELDRGSTEYKSGNFKVKRVKVRVTTTPPPTTNTVLFITPETTLPATETDTHSADSSESVTNIQKGPTLSPNEGIELIESPNLGPKENQDRDKDMKNDNAFLDILVGSDDHKTLITKETNHGIITSAILPPWYDTSSNSTDTLELTNHTLRFTKTDTEDESKEDHSKPKSDLDILLNLFSNSPLPQEGIEKSGYPQSETYVPEQSAEESSRETHLKDLEEQFKPFFGSGPEDGNPTGLTGTTGQQKVSPANTAFHYGSSDGTTHIYGYYPEEDLEEGESVDQVDIEIGDNDKARNIRNDSREDPVNSSGSDVINIAFDPKAQPEIVIEPDAGEGEAEDGEYTDNDNYPDVLEPIAAGSDIQSVHHVYAQPPEKVPQQQPITAESDLGGGIRRPTSDEGDLYPSANEPKPQQTDWSMKQEGTAELPPNDEAPDEYEFSEELEDEDRPMEEDPKDAKGTPYSTEDSNADHVLERKPILNMDESMHTNKKDDDPSTATTTAKPRVRVYEVYSEPFRTTAQPPENITTEKPDVSFESEETEPATNKSGFVPPKPISFHENPLFSLTNNNPHILSRDGWRPVLYDQPGGGGSKNRPNPQKKVTMPTSNEQYYLSTSMQPPPFSSSPTTLQITTPIRPPPTTSNPQMSPPEEYEDEGSLPASNEQWYNDQPATGDGDSRGSESKLKIKPSMQIPMPPASNPPRVKFPPNENQQLNRQQMMHPQQQQQQQQQQNPQPNVQNNFIDRTKYMHRPARPPILMRRKPPFNLPFSNRKREKTPVGNNIPNRNFPRGPYPAAGSNGPGSGPFHPDNPNAPVVRHRHDFNPNINAPVPQGGPLPGTVRWPADDNFVRRNIPPHMRRHVG